MSLPTVLVGDAVVGHSVQGHVGGVGVTVGVDVGPGVGVGGGVVLKTASTQ